MQEERCSKPGHNGVAGQCPQCYFEARRQANDPVNMMQALGVNKAPQGPTAAPAQMQLAILTLAAKYLLYERSEETGMTVAFCKLVEERHNHFHKKHTYVEGPKKGQLVSWQDCSNEVCQQARDAIAANRRKEVFISPIAYELMQRWHFNFQPMPAMLRIWLSEKPEGLPPTENETRQTGRIVLTD